MMLDIDALNKMLILDEGNMPFPYTDTVGKITIGIGRNLTDNGLLQNEIMMLLANDIRSVESEIEALDWYQGLDDVRKLVIADMCFNLGLPRLLTFRNMIISIKIKDYVVAADEMLDSKWAGQVGVRAERLSHMMRTGEMHEDYD